MMRESVGQGILSYNNLYLHIRVVRLSEDSNNFSERRNFFCRPSHYLGLHNLTFFNIAAFLWRNYDLLQNPFIRRNNNPKPLAPFKPPHNGLVRPIQNSYNPALLFAATFCKAFNPHNYFISVHCSFKVSGIYKYIIAAVFRHDKTKSVRMTGKLANNKVHLCRKAVSLASYLYNAAVFNQLLQKPFKHIPFFFRNHKLAHKLLKG